PFDRGGGRAAWLRPDLQARLFSVTPAGNPVHLAGRDVVPRRPSGCHCRVDLVCTAPRHSFLRSERLHCADDPSGAGSRSLGQFHQRGTVGPPHRSALGHGVPTRWRGGASPFPAVRDAVRRLAAVRLAVVVFQFTPPPWPGEWPVSARLWPGALLCGIHPRARRLPGTARGGAFDGPAAIDTDGAGRRAHSLEECRKIVPRTDRLIRSVPPSSGTPAASEATMAIMRCPSG